MRLKLNTKSDKPPTPTMTAEERMRLIMKPFPTVHVSSPKGNSQAPRWAKYKLDRENRETRYELE